MSGPVFIRSAVEFERSIAFNTTTESLTLDFKALIHDRQASEETARRNAQKEICRDVAQFANTLGGALLVGVAERFDSATGLKVASGVATVNDPDALRHWIEQAISNFLVPSSLSHEVVPIRMPQGNVIAVNVPPSRALVYLWDRADGTIECLRRTSHGKARMNPDEVERHMMNASRAAQLALSAAVDAVGKEGVEISGGIWGYTGVPGGPVPRIKPAGRVDLGQIGETTFELRIPLGSRIVSLAVPFDLMRAAWVTSGHQVGIALSARIICSTASGDLALDPS
jgi:hypothetical protein